MSSYQERDITPDDVWPSTVTTKELSALDMAQKVLEHHGYAATAKSLHHIKNILARKAVEHHGHASTAKSVFIKNVLARKAKEHAATKKG